MIRRIEKRLLSVIEEVGSREEEGYDPYSEEYWTGYRDGMVSFAKRLLDIINEDES